MNGPLESVGAIGSDRHLEPLVLQCRSQPEGEVLVVFNQQNTGHEPTPLRRVASGNSTVNRAPRPGASPIHARPPSSLIRSATTREAQSRSAGRSVAVRSEPVVGCQIPNPLLGGDSRPFVIDGHPSGTRRLGRREGQSDRLTWGTVLDRIL